MNTFIVEIRVNLGKHVILVLSDLLSMICENNMEPAVQYLDVILKRINNKVPIIPYVMLIHYRQTSELQMKSEEISKNYPKIIQLKNPQVEKLLIEKHSDELEKIFCVTKLLQEVELEQFSDSEDQIEISPEVMQHMTDITILEFLQAERFAEAVSVIKRDGLLPTMNIFEMLVENLCKKGKANTGLLFSYISSSSVD